MNLLFLKHQLRPNKSTKETAPNDVGPSHVQLDIIFELSFGNVVDVSVLSKHPQIELVENQNIKHTEANQGVSTKIVNTIEGCRPSNVALRLNEKKKRKFDEKNLMSPLESPRKQVPS